MKNFVLPFLATAALCSCTEKALVPDIKGADISSLSHEMIVLGEQLEDPYSVDNITKALNSLYPTKAGRVDVRPTDKYVRFLPEGQEQYDALVNEGYYLVDHPLDYRIVKDGDYYHDPEVPSDHITWQYAVVSTESQLPKGIRSEVLDECYIAENDHSTRAGADFGVNWEEVEREAFRLTGNEDLLAPRTKGDADMKPAGFIRIVDPDLETGESVGVAGVKVAANSFVKIATAYTDEEGEYKMDRAFASDVRYRLVFQNRKGFGIGFNLLLVPASMSTLGTASPDGLSVELDSSSDRKLFTRAVVNNAVYDYFCRCSSESISRPPSNLRIWLFQNLSSSSAPMLQQGAFIDNGIIGKYLGEYKDLLKMFMPDVTIGLKNMDRYASIYTMAAHEAAHASHFSKVGKTYWDKYIMFVLKSFVTSGWQIYGTGTEENAGYCEVGEMWAYYMENIICRDRYSRDAVTSGMSYWFSPQILLYMDERGVGESKIFRALDSDVTSGDEFQSRLENLYPENKSVIKQAFDRYDY